MTFWEPLEVPRQPSRHGLAECRSFQFPDFPCDAFFQTWLSNFIGNQSCQGFGHRGPVLSAAVRPNLDGLLDAGIFRQLLETVGAEQVLKFGDRRGLVLLAGGVGQRSANKFMKRDAAGVSPRRGPAEKADQPPLRGNAVGIATTAPLNVWYCDTTWLDQAQAVVEGLAINHRNIGRFCRDQHRSTRPKVPDFPQLMLVTTRIPGRRNFSQFMM